MVKINKLLDITLPKWLLLTLSAVFLFRIPSFFEPFYYGDELIYLTLGNAIRKGLVLYKDIHDNKTPLIYFLAAISGNVFWFRAILCFWMIATIILFWKLSKKLFPKKEILHKTTTVTFAILTSLPILEGQIANSELFLIGFVIGGIYLALKKDGKYLFLSGICLSIATLFKVPAIFDAGVIFFLFVLVFGFTKKKVGELFIKVALFSLGLALPILAFFAWYYIRGAFNEYLTAAFLQNLGYVASTRLGSVQNSVPLITKLTPIIIRGAIVFCGMVILFAFRKKLSKPYIIAVVWLLTSLFAATLSERPYPHYLIQSTPAIGLLIGMLLTVRVKEQALTLIPLTFALLVPVYYKYWYYSPIPYLSHFKGLVTERDKEKYLTLFGSNVPKNYLIAEEVKMTVSSNERVFVWGDAPPIYSLSGTIPPIKYVANYHIYDYSSVPETVQSLMLRPPRLIVIMPGESAPEELFLFLRAKYRLLNNAAGAQFWYNIPNDT